MEEASILNHATNSTYRRFCSSDGLQDQVRLDDVFGPRIEEEAVRQFETPPHDGLDPVRLPGRQAELILARNRCPSRNPLHRKLHLRGETASSYGQQAVSSLDSAPIRPRASSSCPWRMKLASRMPSSHLTCMNVNVLWSLVHVDATVPSPWYG